MPIDPEKLRSWPVPEVEQTYTVDDVIRYGLAVGYGSDPLDESQLRFVHEDGLRAAPTLPVVLACPWGWLADPATGVDWSRVVHGEQSLTLHAPIPTAATVRGRTRVTAVVDKGDAGALVHQERIVTDVATGLPLATLGIAIFCRGVGGFAGSDESPAPLPAVPAREPNAVCDLPTAPQQALWYRLAGDRNPLHALPGTARQAGFSSPILHGLATFGVAGHALLRGVCGYQVHRLRSMAARFTAPVFPGETLRTELWREGDGRIRFRTRSLERDVVVVDRGTAEVDSDD
jgi:acyl dehydratase